jgi:hypothetical protein
MYFTSLLFMPRRFRRYARSARTVKPVHYANKTVAGQAQAVFPTHGTVAQVVVASTTAQGVRKVKNPTLRLVMAPPDPATFVLWALIYGPQGFPDTSLKLMVGAQGEVPASIFEPNQNVIMSGLLNATGPQEPVTYRSRLARNLESGDAIYLLVLNPHDAQVNISIAYSLNYAICYG